MSFLFGSKTPISKQNSAPEELIRDSELNKTFIKRKASETYLTNPKKGRGENVWSHDMLLKFRQIINNLPTIPETYNQYYIPNVLENIRNQLNHEFHEDLTFGKSAWRTEYM